MACYECKNYNHVDCRQGKKGRDGRIYACYCVVCQVPGVKYKRRFK